MTERINSCCIDLLQMINHFVCICEDSEIVWVNEAGFRLLHAPNTDSVLGRPIYTFITEDFLELFVDGLELLAEEEEGIPLKILTTTGHVIDVKCYVSSMASEEGHERYLVDFQDISHLIKASHDTRDREQRMTAILKAVDQAVISIDEFGIIKSANTVAVNMFGYAQMDMIGKNISALMPEPHGSSHDEYLIRYHRTNHSRIIDKTRELEAMRADGTSFPIELTVTEVVERNGRSSFVGSIRDITVSKRQKERIRFLALNDSLTGLPNRASFIENIESALKRARRNGRGVALLFIDLDEFKPINDTLGHEAGDTVLKVIAERLQNIIRETDMAARLGGDEFVLVLENVMVKESVADTAKIILKEVSQPIAVNDTTCSVGVSIGISHFPTDAENMSELLNAADKAMYKVKAAGRNNFSFC